MKNKTLFAFAMTLLVEAAVVWIILAISGNTSQAVIGLLIFLCAALVLLIVLAFVIIARWGRRRPYKDYRPSGNDQGVRS